MRTDQQILTAPDLSSWREGNTGTEGVWSFDSGSDGRHVMMTALIHGNEVCGAWALRDLLAAGVQPAKGRLTLAFCNLAAFDRYDAANQDASRFVEEDLNRQWSSERLSNLSSLERRRASALVPFVEAADMLLDLHSMHEPSTPLSLTGISSRNVELALRMGAPAHIVIDAGHKDGTRMRDYGPFAPSAVETSSARSLLVECGFHTDPASRLVAQDQCVRFLELAGICKQADLAGLGWRLGDPFSQTVLEVCGAVVASGENFRFTEPYVGLETIDKKGTVIGFDEKKPVVTPFDGCVLVMPSTRQARRGVTVVRFAKVRKTDAHV